MCVYIYINNIDLRPERSLQSRFAAANLDFVSSSLSGFFLAARATVGPCWTQPSPQLSNSFFINFSGLEPLHQLHSDSAILSIRMSKAPKTCVPSGSWKQLLCSSLLYNIVWSCLIWHFEQGTRGVKSYWTDPNIPNSLCTLASLRVKRLGATKALGRWLSICGSSGLSIRRHLKTTLLRNEWLIRQEFSHTLLEWTATPALNMAHL